MQKRIVTYSLPDFDYLIHKSICERFKENFAMGGDAFL